MSQKANQNDRSITPKKQQHLAELKKTVSNTGKIYEQLKEKTKLAQQQEERIREVILNAEQQIQLMKEQRDGLIEKFNSLKAPDDYMENVEKQFTLIDQQMEKTREIEDKYKELVTQNEDLKKQLQPLKNEYDKKQQQHIAQIQHINNVLQQQQTQQEKLQRVIDRNKVAHETVKGFVEGQKFYIEQLEQFKEGEYKQQVKDIESQIIKIKELREDVKKKKRLLQTEADALQNEYEKLQSQLQQ